MTTDDDQSLRFDPSTVSAPSNSDTAIEAIKRGFQPVPLQTNGKRPAVPEWGKLRWENTPEGLEKARVAFDTWAAEGGAGIGVLLGQPSGGLVDVDLDHPLTGRLVEHFLPRTRAVSGRASAPRSHYWYLVEPGTLQTTRQYKMPRDPGGGGAESIVEYRSTGGQTVIPGSVHPSGEDYEWAAARWGGVEGPTVTDGQALAVRVATLAFCTVLLQYWPGPGSRHDAYLALAGALLRVGDGGVHPYWERNARDIILSLAYATGDEDGAEGRVAETIPTTVKRLREGKPVKGWGILGEVLGEDAVKQARNILGDVESLAGLPPRTSGSYSLEAVSAAMRAHDGTHAASVTLPAGIGAGEASEASTGRAEVPDASEWSTPHSSSEQVRGRDEDYGIVDADLPEVSVVTEAVEDRELTGDPLEDRLGTWEALDLEPYLTGQVQPVKPELLERDDGQALLYPGRLNMLYGPSEAAKSWIAMHTCVQELRRGNRVVYLDFEDEPVNAIQRMMLLGASVEDLQRGFRYVRPEEPLAPMQRTRWGDSKPSSRGELNNSIFKGLLEAHDPSLIVADGMTVLYGLHGLDSNDSVQTDIITTWLKTLTRNGRSTVIIVDHTAKNPQRGSLPIGSQHKVAMVQGTLLQTYPVAQPMPGAKGIIDLIVLKDRPGQVRAASQKSGEKAQLAARVVMDSTDPGRVEVSLEAPSDAPGAGAQTVNLAGQKTAGKSTAPTATPRDVMQAQRDLEMQKAEMEILDCFGGDLDLELSHRQIWERVTGQPWPGRAAANRTGGALDRLISRGTLVKLGGTSDARYALVSGDAD